MIYFAYFHATTEYGIFWGNLTNNKKVFLPQKRIIRIINVLFSIRTVPDEVLVEEFGNLYI